MKPHDRPAYGIHKSGYICVFQFKATGDSGPEPRMPYVIGREICKLVVVPSTMCIAILGQWYALEAGWSDAPLRGVGEGARAVARRRSAPTPDGIRDPRCVRTPGEARSSLASRLSGPAGRVDPMLPLRSDAGRQSRTIARPVRPPLRHCTPYVPPGPKTPKRGMVGG
eukprot:6212437-Pleurochrysis_carterae.AAC.4